MDFAKEELEKAEKSRNTAAMLSSSAQRNLDSYTSSVKSIEEEIPGAADPRKRKVPKKGGEEAPGRRTPRATSSSPRPKARPTTPNKTTPRSAGQQSRTPRAASQTPPTARDTGGGEVAAA